VLGNEKLWFVLMQIYPKFEAKILSGTRVTNLF